MSDEDMENKERDREIARNERKQQIIGDIRVSTWAILVAVIVGLTAFTALGWIIAHKN